MDLGAGIGPLKTLQNGPLRFTAITAGFADNPEGPVILCLHGFPDNARSFRHQMPVWAKAGYRVIAPTLRGYEPSSQPADRDYSLASMAGDIPAWLDQLGVQQVHLVGHDWGAVIAYIAGALYGNRFASITTIAIPPIARVGEAAKQVPKQARNAWYQMFFLLRGLPDLVLPLNDLGLIRLLWRNWSPSFSLPPEESASMRETFAAPGVKRAALAYYRQNLSYRAFLGLGRNETSALAIIPAPTLAITGAEDGCMDTRLYEHSLFEEDFPNGHRMERVDGAGHFVHQEKPEIITPMIQNWIQAQV